MPESAVNLSNNSQDDDAVLSQYDNSQPIQHTLKEGQLEYNWMDTLSKKFQMGSEQLANSRNNAWVMGTGGGLDDEQELKMLQAGAQKVQTGFDPAAYEAQPWALRAVGDALETLPGIADTVGQGAIGGAIAGGSTALASRVVPHPFVQAVAGSIGFGQGYTAGSVKSIWEQSAGALYGELRLAGVKRDTARLLGFTFGSLNASMEFLGTHVLQKIAGGAFSLARKTAIQNTLDTPYVKTIESNMLGRLGMHVATEVGTETATEGAQQTGTELAKVAATVLEKMPADSFTNWTDASSNIKQAMIQALGASLVLGAGASAGGHVLGKATGALQGGAKKAQAKINTDVLNELKESTPAEILRKMQEGLNDLPNAWENPDEQSSVAYDAQGNPYIKTSIIKEQQSTATRPINKTVVQTKSASQTTGQQTLDQISKNAQAIIDQGLQSIYPVDEEVKQTEIPIEKQVPTDNAFDVETFKRNADAAIRVGMPEEDAQSLLKSQMEGLVKARQLADSEGVDVDQNGLRSRTVAQGDVFLHGTSKENAEKIKTKGRLDSGKTFGNYQYSVLGEGTSYLTSGNGWWLDPTKTGGSRAVSYTDQVKISLPEGARLLRIDTLSEQKAVAEKLGMSTSDFLNGLTADKGEDNKTSKDIIDKLKKLGYAGIEVGAHSTSDFDSDQVGVFKGTATRVESDSAQVRNRPDIPTESKFTPTLESEPDVQLRLPLVDWRPLNADETQARLNQIKSDRSTLAKEAKRLEAQITIQEKTGSGGFKAIEKWQNVQQAMDALDSEREVLESGLATTDIEGPKYGKLRIKKLAGLFDKLSAQAQKLQEEKVSAKEGKQQSLLKGMEKGKKTEQRAIRRMQQDLLNIINTVTDDSNIKAQVKQFVNKVTTPEQMAKAIQQIQTKVLFLETKKSENAQIKERQKVFDKVVKLIQGQRVRIDNGHPSAPLPTEITNKLQTLRGYLKDEKTLKLAEFEFGVQHGATPIDQLSPEAREQMQLQNLARNLFSGDALSYNVAAANIAQWVVDGKQTMAKKQQDLEAEKTDTINTAKDSLRIPQKKEKSWVQNTGQRRNEFWNDIQAGTWTWNTLLDRLSGKDREHKLTELLDDTVAQRNYLAQKDVTASAFMQAIQKRVQDPDLLQKFVDYQNTEKAVTFTTKYGSQFTESLNKMQMIDAILKFRDASTHEALQEGNKWTLPGDVAPGMSFIERIQGEMTAQDNELIQGILDFYKDYHASINEVYRQEYGVDLPMRENYSPLTRQGYKVDAPFSAEGLQFYSLLPGSAKTREDSKLPILLQNPIDTALHHIGQWEYWKAYTSKLRQINAVIQDTEIRQHIRDEFGSGTLKIMENYVERFMKNDPLPNDPSSSFWSAVRTDLSRHALGFKYVSSFATQMSSGTAMWGAHRPDQILNGILQTVLHPAQTEKALRDSPILRERFKTGANIDLQRALRTQGLMAETIHQLLGLKPDPSSHDAANLFNRMMFAGIQYGDAGVARVFGGPIYHAELAAGKTHTEALTTVERLMEQTQQGSSVSQTPVLFTNPIVRTTIGLFTQQPVQLYGKSMSAVNDFMNSPKKPSDFAILGHRLGAYWIVPGLLLGLAKSTPSWLLPPDEDEDRKRTQIYDITGSALLGPLTGVPLFGDVAQALWFAAAKPLIGVDESARSDYFGKNPVIETLYNNPQKAFQAWASYKKEEEKLIPDITGDKLAIKENKAHLATGRAITGFLGLPAQFANVPLGAMERLSDGDAIGGAISFGGWSPGAVMQRKSKDEMQSINELFKMDENETPYDMIEVFLDSLLQGQKLEDPAEQDKKSKVEVEEFIRSLNPNANGQP